MPRFIHVSTLHAPRRRVFDWHTRPGSFVRETPPGLATLLSGPTDGINPGSELRLRISSPLVAALLPHVRGGPIGVGWWVRHVELVPGSRFVDEQVDGPFYHWRHEHDFADGPDGTTVLTDTVTWDAPQGIPDEWIEAHLRALFRFRERQLRDDLDLFGRLNAPPTTVVMSGSSGLVGTQLRALLTAAGHRVVRLVRRDPSGPDEVRWDPRTLWLPKGTLRDAGVVINLAGETIGGRFTRARKAEILSSRVDATTTIAEAMAREAPNASLVQASAIGIYGPRRPGELLDEASPRGKGFLADVVDAWERAAAPATRAGVRTVFLRTGIVLSGVGGALPPQLPLYLAGLGGRMTSADAELSWIGLDDLVLAYAHAAFTPSLSGPVPAVGPNPVTQAEFAETLGAALHRPALLPTPSFGPKLVLGSEGYDQLIDTDQRVSAAKLIGSGFRFGQVNLDEALRHVLLKPAATPASRSAR